MNKRTLSIAMFATLALAACGSANESSGTAKVKNGVGRGSSISAQPGSGTPRTKNAALSAPETTTSPDASRREVLGSFDEKTLTFTFTKAIPRLTIMWYDNTKWAGGSEWTLMNVTSVGLMSTVGTNYMPVGDFVRARLNFYFGATSVENVYVTVPQVPGYEKGPCSFRFEINNITPCIPVSGAVYQWFDDFKAIGDPQTLTFPANAPASTVNFWKLGPPPGTARVKARFTFARGGGTEDAYFNVYMFKNDIITTSRTGKVNPALIKGTDMSGMK